METLILTAVIVSTEWLLSRYTYT